MVAFDIYMQKRTQDRRIDPERRVRFEQYRLQLVRRLEGVCSSMSQSELHSLTIRMTRLYHRYETVTGLPKAR